MGGKPLSTLSFLKSSAQSHALTLRWIFGGPVAAILTILIMMGMAVWWPAGAGRVDNILVPLVLFPVIWALVFFYVLLDDDMLRVSTVMTVLVIGHLGLVLL
ncbi:MAG: hypothetical protein AAGE61_19935 [Pseudomonadota bacterium]